MVSTIDPDDLESIEQALKIADAWYEEKPERMFRTEQKYLDAAEKYRWLRERKALLKVK